MAIAKKSPCAKCAKMVSQSVFFDGKNLCIFCITNELEFWKSYAQFAEDGGKAIAKELVSSRKLLLDYEYYLEAQKRITAQVEERCEGYLDLLEQYLTKGGEEEMPVTQNLNSVDAARLLVLTQKSNSSGLQESEKEELKNLEEKARRAI